MTAYLVDYFERHWRAVLLICVALIGLLPHIGFSLLEGEFRFYTSAWDEEFYGLLAINEIPSAGTVHRNLSNAATLFLVKIFGMDGMYIVSDIIWPTLAAFFAASISNQLFQTSQAKLGGAALLLIATDLLSLSSIVFFIPPLNISSVISGLPDSIKLFFVDNYSSFLYLYRTPEPQFSLVFFFATIAIVLWILNTGKNLVDTRFRVGSAVALCIAGVAAPFLYVPIGYSIYFLMLVTIAILSSRIKFRFVLRLFGPAIVTAAASFILSRTLEHSQLEDVLVYSHLPLISVSVVLGLCGLFVMVWMRERLDSKDPFVWLGASSFLVPIIVLNQQLITGVHVMPQVWEKTVTHIFLALGLLLVARSVKLRKRWSAKIDGSALGISVAALTILVWGHFAGTVYRFPDNYASMMQLEAYQRAVHAAPASTKVHQIPVVLPTPRDALFQVRAGLDVPIIGRYSEQIRTQDKEKAFSWISRQGISPNQLGNNLETALDSDMPFPWLMFFFKPKDIWWLFSNGRALQTERVAESIPIIVAEYAAWIRNLPLKEPMVVIIREEQLPPSIWNGRLQNDLVTTISSQMPYMPTYYVYLQHRL